MTKEDLIGLVDGQFPSNNMVHISVFRQWYKEILIPQLWREPTSGGTLSPLPIIYGTQDPNLNEPTDPFELGYYYAQTNDGTETGDITAFYQYNGTSWIVIAGIEGSNFVLYTGQSKTEPERKVARTNIGLDFDESNINPLEEYLNNL